MQGRVSIFASGKMISVGTTSEERAFRELEYAKRFLIERGFTTSTRLQPKIHNVVVRAELEESVDLEELARNGKIIYEPEQFPGGILRIEEPCKATILIFASGKAVIAGLQSSDLIDSTIERLKNIMHAREGYTT